MTEFPTKAAEKEEKKMGSEIFFNVGVPIPFSMGNFHFLAAEKLIGGVQLQNWLASDHRGAYTSMSHPFLAQNMFVILKTRWPSNDSLLGRPACTIRCTSRMAICDQCI